MKRTNTISTFARIACVLSVALLPLMTGCKKDNDEIVDYSSTFEASGERGVGALPGVFSVAEGRAVCFSKGNLQFFVREGTHTTADGETMDGTWRFADEQYFYQGYGNVSGDTSCSDHIDLFGWGTSGWQSGANAVSPCELSVVSTDYTPGNNARANLTGGYVNADWGQYNAIDNGGDAPGLWRVLSRNEWSYIFHQRTNTKLNNIPNARFAKAQVNGINGMLIFPDKYQHPTRVALPEDINVMDATFSNNHYDGADWDSLEVAGVVFLPAAGMRYGTDIMRMHTCGQYWSSTSNGALDAYFVSFLSGAYDPTTFGYRCNGRSVRLVQDVKVEE